MIKMNTKQRERVEMFIKDIWKAPPEYTGRKLKDFNEVYKKIREDVVSNTKIHIEKFTSMGVYLNEVKKHLK